MQERHINVKRQEVEKSSKKRIAYPQPRVIIAG